MTRSVSAALVVIALFGASLVQAQITVSSPGNKHNLSVSGPGPVKAVGVTEICVFCHTPHNASPGVPLWNQELSSASYQPYTSSTLKAAVGVPTGSSKLCLGCHDGTIALGSTRSRGRISMQGVGSSGVLTGASALGTDLRHDHPISFVPVTGGQILAPPPGSPVQLDASGQVQCRSCHEPHRMDADPTTGKFLVMNNSASGLCLVCHAQTYWASNPSTHNTSTKSYTALQGAQTGYATVQTNGCESCHKPHTAGSAPRSLKAVEEQTCGSGALQCHGSSGVAMNIEAEFRKTYSHPTYSQTPSAHDAAEWPTGSSATLPEASPSAPRHAECPDCHNAHASYAASATRPRASGKLAGVWGIDVNGAVRQPAGTPPAVNEHEICLKCHGDSANKPQAGGGPSGPYPNRLAAQFNMRLMFNPTSPSYHPVASAGRNGSVPSLIGGWTASSVMYCTDCHDNDQGPKAPTPGSGPSGPHGSSYKHLLVARYDMDNGSYTESAAAYALCYKCHDRTVVLTSASFRGHNLHIVSQRSPCSVCHDPHGISSTQGNLTNNKFLINFDRRFVTPSQTGVLRFDDLGAGRVRCYLTCHGQDHDPKSY